jgi:hypothetical protein
VLGLTVVPTVKGGGMALAAARVAKMRAETTLNCILLFVVVVILNTEDVDLVKNVGKIQRLLYFQRSYVNLKSLLGYGPAARKSSFPPGEKKLRVRSNASITVESMENIIHRRKAKLGSTNSHNELRIRRPLAVHQPCAKFGKFNLQVVVPAGFEQPGY